jgi:hypothetical protein
VTDEREALRAELMAEVRSQIEVELAAKMNAAMARGRRRKVGPPPSAPGMKFHKLDGLAYGLNVELSRLVDGSDVPAIRARLWQVLGERSILVAFLAEH